MEKTSLSSTLKDFIALTKPRIVLLCLFMALGGMLLAPEKASPLQGIMGLLGTLLSVCSANTLNMVIERNSDKLMRRTRLRPLAAGRLSKQQALFFGVFLGILSVVLLVTFVNTLTALIALSANILYSFVYTPLKFVTPLALVIGAIPGAAPPLMGWTSMTNAIDWGAFALFLVLFTWQMPHFIAIALLYKEDYAAAHIRTVPLVRGEKIAKVQGFLWTLTLLAASIFLVQTHVGGSLYLILALLLGVWFLSLSLLGFKKTSGKIWARKFFLASLIYLPALTLALVFDRFLQKWIF